MISELEVAGLKLHAGTRRRGFLRVGPYFDHLMPIRRYVLIPFTVVRGAKSGPTLVQIAGCHPTEYAGIDATVKLSNAIRPDELSGNFIGVPCVNIPAFTGPRGLPVGVQIVGAIGTDARLLVASDWVFKNLKEGR